MPTHTVDMDNDCHSCCEEDCCEATIRVTITDNGECYQSCTGDVEMSFCTGSIESPQFELDYDPGTDTMSYYLRCTALDELLTGLINGCEGTDTYGDCEITFEKV